MLRFAWLVAAIMLPCLARCQTLKAPPCPEEEPATVCNAVLHYRDKSIDQGHYCRGCANCSGIEIPLTSANSFLWQHYEHPELRVQFLKCAPFPERPRCGVRDDLAAVFVTPQFSWNPKLQDFYCACPEVNDAPLYQLRSWSLQGNTWVYEFVCPTEHCKVPKDPVDPHLVEQKKSPTKAAAGAGRVPATSPQPPIPGAVCAEKHQARPHGPVSVSFACTCPLGYHCVINDVVLKSDDASAPTGRAGSGGVGGGGAAAAGSGKVGVSSGAVGSGGGGASSGDWQPVVVKHCQRVDMAGAAAADESGGGRGKN